MDTPTAELWRYRNDVVTNGSDLVGYTVESTDGEHIGRIDDATTDQWSSIVVDTGFWIFGKKRRLPAAVIRQINRPDEIVYITLSKDEVKSAPEYEPYRPVGEDDESYFEPYDTYYRPYL